MAQDSLQQNILITLQDIQIALGRRNNTPLPLFRKQKIHSFTKGLRTDFLYALWFLLALKNNPTIDMAIELAQRIENNQRMHLGSTLSVFASALVMVSAPQMAAISFATHIQDSNEQLIDRLTANFVRLLELLAQAVKDNQKKKKAKVDFVLDPNKVSTFTTDNNKPPKTKVFKNPPKLESPEIVQKSGLYYVVKDLMETPAHITFGQLITHSQFRKDLHKSLIPKKKIPKTNKCSCQAELADNSNVTSLICKAQVADYFIDLILDSGLSVSVIAKHFLEAIGRKIDKPSTWLITNAHGDKKKDLGIAKAVPGCINGISIKTDMEVYEAKKYTIIVSNKWLKKAKALLDYELCELSIRCDKKPIVVKCCHWTTPSATKQNQEEDESNNNESNNED
ncbi:hypothetical protein G9A89_016692 [Geosiphon pyriformis]|nr:hypothetical protein G9A89_016692 [Geosiphon pyriformis]